MPGVLTHSPAAIIAKLIVDNGYGNDYTSATWPVFRHNDPDSPDSVIVVKNTAGLLQGTTQFDGEIQEKHGIQITVRSALEESGHTKIVSLMNSLDALKLQTVVIDSVTYIVHSLNRTSSILPLGKDLKSSNRVKYTVNYVTSIRQQS